MVELETGIAAIDGLPIVVGAINGDVADNLGVQVALYLAMSAHAGAGVVVSLARDTFELSTPIAANAVFLDAHGYADVEAWADAVVEGNGALHDDDVHMFATRISTKCCGDFKVRFKIASGPTYVRSHGQLVHFAVGGDTYRVMLTLPEVA